jgi:hypothetical protein
MFITVREISKLRGFNPTFLPAYAFHFKKPAKIHFFLYPQSVGDIFFQHEKKGAETTPFSPI